MTSSTWPAGVVLIAVAVLEIPAAGASRFRERAAELGLMFAHVNGASGQYHLPEIMGAGCAFLDYDGDGDLDVLLIQGRALDRHLPAANPPASPRLFRNDLDVARGAASLRFTDVSERAGFATGDYGMGVATGDYDNDGDPDLYLTNVGPNRLYRNDGSGHFTDVTRAAGAGLDDPRWSTSASFSDYDADGDLDLFVANYLDFTIAGSKVCSDPAGARDYCGPLQFRPVPDRLFRNDGNSTFSDVSESAGITRAYGAGLGVASADFNGDGRLDFYVANDGMANQLWINRGNGTFVDDALLAGVAFNIDGQPEGSMGLAIGDSDGDGDLDIFITNITGETHAFYENLGGGRFEDRRITTGLAAATRPTRDLARTGSTMTTMAGWTCSLRTVRSRSLRSFAAIRIRSVSTTCSFTTSVANASGTSLARVDRLSNQRSWVGEPHSVTSIMTATSTCSSPTTAARFGCCSTRQAPKALRCTSLSRASRTIDRALGLAWACSATTARSSGASPERTAAISPHATREST